MARGLLAAHGRIYLFVSTGQSAIVPNHAPVQIASVFVETAMRAQHCIHTPDAGSVALTSPLAERKTPGLHLIGDLYECRGDSRLMTDAAYLEAFCQRAVQESGLTTVGSLFHSFGDGDGVTGTVVLAESHLALHTWPEDNYVTLDVYVCSYRQDNSAKAEHLFNAVMQAFAPQQPHLHRVVRA